MSHLSGICAAARLACDAVHVGSFVRALGVMAHMMTMPHTLITLLCTAVHLCAAVTAPSPSTTVLTRASQTATSTSPCASATPSGATVTWRTSRHVQPRKGCSCWMWSACLLTTFRLCFARRRLCQAGVGLILLVLVLLLLDRTPKLCYTSSAAVNSLQVPTQHTI